MREPPHARDDVSSLWPVRARRSAVDDEMGAFVVQALHPFAGCMRGCMLWPFPFCRGGCMAGCMEAEMNALNRSRWHAQNLGDGAKGLALLSGSHDKLADG